MLWTLYLVSHYIHKVHKVQSHNAFHYLMGDSEHLTDKIHESAALTLTSFILFFLPFTNIDKSQSDKMNVSHKEWLGCHLSLRRFADISSLIVTLRSNALSLCTWLIPVSLQMLCVCEPIPFYFPVLRLTLLLCWVYAGVFASVFIQIL